MDKATTMIAHNLALCSLKKRKLLQSLSLHRLLHITNHARLIFKHQETRCRAMFA
jgi:hypothetical protein